MAQADMISDYEGSQGEEMNHDKLKYKKAANQNKILQRTTKRLSKA